MDSSVVLLSSDYFLTSILMVFKISKYRIACITLNVVFLSFPVYGEKLNYQFQWFRAPVADLSINFGDSFTEISNSNTSKKEFKLTTEGVLKIYRNYSIEGSIKRNNNSWDYYLFGQDRGQPEEKLITYFFDKAPKLHKFIDDDGMLPITIDPHIDSGSIDPFSSLFITIEQLSSEHMCDNEYSIMDGKRRYKVKVKLLEKEINKSKLKKENNNIVYKCRFSFVKLEKENKKWPFNKKNRSMNVWFSSELNYKPIRFILRTPIGSIIGVIKNKES